MNDQPQAPNGHERFRLSRIGGADSCQCVEMLIRKMRKAAMKCLQIDVVTNPSGNCVKGVKVVTPSIGTKWGRTISLIQFNFCPFCGGDLRPVDDVPS